MSSNAAIVTATFGPSRSISALSARWTWNPQTYYGADISPYNYQSVMHYGFLSSKRNRRRGPPALRSRRSRRTCPSVRYVGPDGT